MQIKTGPEPTGSIQQSLSMLVQSINKGVRLMVSQLLGKRITQASKLNISQSYSFFIFLLYMPEGVFIGS